MATVTLTGPDLHLTTLSYPRLNDGDSEEVATLKQALKRDGAVAIADIPQFPEQRSSYFLELSTFSDLPKEKKDEVQAGGVDAAYSYIGYNVAAEKFVGPGGKTLTDVSKASYYAIYPDHEQNKWLPDSGLRQAYLDLAKTIHDTGALLMRHTGMLGEGMPVSTLEGAHDVGRMLHYTDCKETDPNPFWCGQHKDHGLITGLTMPIYKVGGQTVETPKGAGLHIKVGDVYRRALADPNCALYQIGDFGQLITNDEAVATEHRVNKPNPPVRGLERYTMALFFDPPLETKVDSSTSVLTQDSRFTPGVTFENWHLRSLERYQSL